MGKILKKAMAVGLIGCISFSLAACGGSTTGARAQGDKENSGNQEEASTEQAAAEQTDGAGASGIKIGYNYFGTGGYSLAALANQSQIVLDACKDESTSADDQFSVENIITDVENMIASGCDGIIIWLPAEPL